MTLPGQRRRWRPVSLLAALLAAVTLLPVTVLFAGHWRELNDQRDFAHTERDGVAYLEALAQVTLALTDAQSAAVSGAPVRQDLLEEAIAATDRLDEQLGDTLRVGDRWRELRERIAQATAAPVDPRSAYPLYEEATSLLLDLYGKLRETSGLIRDPAPEVYYLQDAAAEELPEALVAAGRLVDLATLAVNAPGPDSAVEAVGLSVARVELVSPVDDLVFNLQAALEGTSSRTLSSNLLGQLDQLLRAQDELLLAVPAGGPSATIDLNRLAQLRIEFQLAGELLFGALLGELDELVSQRLSTLSGQQRGALAALAFAILLALGLAGAGLALGYRAEHQGRDGAEGTEPPVSPPPPEYDPAGLVTREPISAR